MGNVTYTQKYNNDDKKPIKIFCLAFCILLDLIVFMGIIACFSTKRYIDLIIYAIIFIVALSIRIASLFLTYEIVISFQDGNISIIKKYPVKKILIYKGQVIELKLNKYDSLDDKNIKKYVSLCSKSCEEGVYVIELLQRKYLIRIDDYLFSLIEVNNDLS